MTNFKLFLCALSFFAFSGGTLHAQVLDPSDDGIIPEATKHFRNNRVVPYPHLRQDDMLWSSVDHKVGRKLIIHFIYSIELIRNNS